MSSSAHLRIRCFPERKTLRLSAGSQPMTACGGNFIGRLLNRNKRSPRWGAAPVEVADGAGKPTAGPIRNAQMANYADALIAFWDGSSTGTRDMIRKAEEKGLKVHVQIIRK